MGTPPSPPAASSAGNGLAGPRQLDGGAFTLVLLLYLATLSVDAVRKLTGLPTAASAVVYVLTGVIYVVLLPKVTGWRRPVPRTLLLWLALLSLWCAAEAVAQRIPVAMALLGWVSYVFFVPLIYVGAELMADDRRAARTLRIVAVAGGVVGLGAIASTILGLGTPAVLQPIVPGVAVHSSAAGNIYLAPSVFATAEEASEHLLIALFAWFALVQLRSARLGRITSTMLGVFIAVGLFATARRADILAAIVGVVGLALLGLAARRGRRRRRAATQATQARLAPALLLAAAGSVFLLSLLGTGKVLPFLASSSNAGTVLRFMFSPAHPAALTGQGPGTSTQGAGVVGATAYPGRTLQGSYIAYVLNGRSFLTAEGGLTKTWLELGITGVVLYACVFASVLGPLIRRLGRLDRIGWALIVLVFALGIVFLKGHQSLDNPLVQPLFWLAAGGAWGRLRAASHRQQQQQGGAPQRTAPHLRQSRRVIQPSVPA
jgi:hypothetical protein